MTLEVRDRVAWQRLGTYRNLKEFRGLRDAMAPEVERCFSPQIHEGQRRPYGALIARDDDASQLGRLVDVGAEEAIRGASNGINTLAFCVKGRPVRLLRLDTPIRSQEDASTAAFFVDGAFLRVDAKGTIWLASSHAITTIDDKNGWTRPSLSVILDTLGSMVSTAPSNVLRAIAQLTYSRLSPSKVGTTLLYALTDADSFEFQTQGASLEALGLNVLQEGDWALIEHELRHADGALIIARNGRVLRKGVILSASSLAATQVHASGGTRHQSACRHTFDRPDLLAFVVSADGPVEVYSDGNIAGTLPFLKRDKVPWNPSGGEMWTDELRCPQCKVLLKTRKIILYGWREWEEGHCPICRAEVAQVHGWHVDVGLVKDADTIKALADYRAKQLST